MGPQTPLRLAIIGPGRVGQALGRRWVDAGVDLAGFVGPNPSVTVAIAFAGAGQPLEHADLAGVDAVFIATQDDRVETAVASAVAATEPMDGVWFHASGSLGLEVLEPLRQAGARVGALHPICPFPGPLRGYTNAGGQPAVVLTEPEDVATAALLTRLAERATLRPIATTGGDRLLYHAACVLAANGLTALYEAVGQLLGLAMPEAETDEIPAALMRSAISSCADLGPAEALSGPVLRGEAALVARQVRAVEAVDGDIGAVYRGLMRIAGRLAAERGALSLEGLDRMRGVLSTDA